MQEKYFVLKMYEMPPKLCGTTCVKTFRWFFHLKVVQSIHQGYLCRKCMGNGFLKISAELYNSWYHVVKINKTFHEKQLISY